MYFMSWVHVEGRNLDSENLIAFQRTKSREWNPCSVKVSIKTSLLVCFENLVKILRTRFSTSPGSAPMSSVCRKAAAHQISHQTDGDGQLLAEAWEWQQQESQLFATLLSWWDDIPWQPLIFELSFLMRIIIMGLYRARFSNLKFFTMTQKVQNTKRVTQQSKKNCQ